MKSSSENFFDAYGGNAAENNERWFVPMIGAPVATDLIEIAKLRAGERVLDVACGTGIVARRAAERVGPEGAVAGLDINPGMLSVAGALAPEIDWHESSAEAMPLPGSAFDVVTCQMGLQFVADKPAALREMRRVLAPGGRLIVAVPGPTPPLFAVMEEALAQHIDPQLGGFVQAAFALHDVGHVRALIEGAGFRDVAVEASHKTLRLPAPAQFLWQYIGSTPLFALMSQAEEQRRAAFERDVVARWQAFVEDGELTLRVRMVIATARK